MGGQVSLDHHRSARGMRQAQPAGMQMQPDGTRAYVACTPDDYIAVVDLKTLEIAGRIEAGRQPDGLAWAERR